MPDGDTGSTRSEREGNSPSWRRNAALFLATVASVFVTALNAEANSSILAPTRAALWNGLQFTGTLLGILMTHEAAHYVAARYHKVDASLPFFIPLPLLGFGTMGAVIRMRGTIPTRRALLDIGASGPLAGLAVALPLYYWGARHSTVVAINSGGLELGESLALKLLDRLAAPDMPAGMELQLSPVAFGAWGGMLITMLNLLPVGQLDGGHVAYSLFGPRQDQIARLVHRCTLAFFFVSLSGYLLRDLRAGLGFYRLGVHVGNSVFWLMWFEMLAILGSLASSGARADQEDLGVAPRLVAMVGLLVVYSFGRDQHAPLLWVAWFVGLGLLLGMEVVRGALRPHALLDHPSTGSAPLGPARKAVAVLTLAMFVLLFMPSPVTL